MGAYVVYEIDAALERTKERTVTAMPVPARKGDLKTFAKSLAGPAVLAGLLGGLLMITVMILVMGTSGMGYASPLNLGMPAFVFTIAPPASMFPSLLAAMGITLPASVMAQVGPALTSGHVSPAMVHKLGAMLTSMHVPAAKVQMMGLLMTGHATNSTVAALMSSMTPTARNAVMAAMPVSASHVVVGTVLHFAFAAFLGVLFFGIIGAAAWFRLPGLRSSWGVVSAALAGGALVYVINRWGLLPSTNPMMALVPQIAFFLAHLLFGLVVGLVLARALRQRRVSEALPRIISA